MFRDLGELKSLFDGKRALCIAETPFQLLAICSLIDSGKLGDVAWSLIVSDTFEGAPTVASELKETGTFSEVVLIRPDYSGHECHHVGSTYLLKSVFTPRRHRNRYIRMLGNDLGTSVYDLLLCSNPDRLCLDTKKLYVKRGTTVLFDDGIGSHNGGVLKPFACLDDSVYFDSDSLGAKDKLKQLVKKIVCSIFGSNFTLDIKAMCLFGRADECAAEYGGLPVYGLELVDDGIPIDEILMGDCDIRAYRNAKYIYLTFPDEVGEKVLECEREIIGYLDSLLDGEIRIRLHPRRKRRDFAQYSNCLLNEGMWEGLIAKGAITDTTCLISACSTAQYTPVALFGIEPKLVMLYKLFASSGLSVGSFEKASADIVASYKNPERVFIPSTKEEIRDFFVQGFFDGDSLDC